MSKVKVYKYEVRGKSSVDDKYLWFLDQHRSHACSCSRIEVNYIKRSSGYVPEIFGNYQKAGQPSDETESDFYLSEYQDGKYGIWKCNLADQWFIGLQSERGLCQGYAYINSTSKCILNVPKFGWRILERLPVWSLVNANSLSVQCNPKGK